VLKMGVLDAQEIAEALSEARAGEATEGVDGSLPLA
jgi:hypothetical protein